MGLSELLNRVMGLILGASEGVVAVGAAHLGVAAFAKVRGVVGLRI